MWSELYLGSQENPPKHSQELPSGYSFQQSIQEPCALERVAATQCNLTQPVSFPKRMKKKNRKGKGQQISHARDVTAPNRGTEAEEDDERFVAWQMSTYGAIYSPRLSSR